MQVYAYLDFDGKAEEAIEFYKEALGAEEKMLVRFNQMPKGEECHPGAEDKVMHAELQIGEGVIMISDGYCSGAPKFSGISISLNLKDKAEAERLFNAVGQGGEVKMPFEKTFWAEGFGMVDDKFGVSWMVNVDAADSPMQ